MNLSNKKHLIPIVIIILLVLGGAVFYQFSNPQAAQNKSQEEDKKLIAEIGKLIDLPSGENPTVAAVSDITKLSNQPFFQKAKNGDKVLIYPNAQKAFLYSPSLKKILNVAPFNAGSQPTAQPVSATQAATPKTTTKTNSTFATSSAKEK